MSGPLCGIFDSLLHGMGEANEYSLFLSEPQRERIARSLFEAYYAERGGRVIFDANRAWCAQTPALAQLFPQARVICCVRSPAWILDSFERRVQAAPFRRGKMFKGPAAANVYTRVEAMIKGGVVGGALQSLRQAWSGEQAARLLVIRYESLAEQPAAVISRLYELLGEQPFAHDFEHVVYEEPELDAQLGMPGLHRVAGRVERVERKTILPADIFNQHDRSFWDVPGQNPRGVTVL
jgi:sulfotransferase